MKKSLFILLLIFPLLTSCDFLNNKNSDKPIDNNPQEGDNQGEDKPKEDDPPVEDDPHNNNQDENNHPDDIFDESFPTGNKLFKAFFTYGKKIDITLEFTNEALSKMEEYGHTYGQNENYLKNEMYHPCTMKIDIDGSKATYYEVGARLRGNTSRGDAYGFVDSEGHFDTSRNLHFKLNFAQTFDDVNDNDYYIKPWASQEKKNDRDDRKFGKMKKIDFKFNRNHDGTFTKEIYALDAFREEGILAQHANLVTVTFKSETDSRTMVYQALEAVDKQLVKKVYENDYSGDLYKCLYQNSKADLTNTNNLGIEREYFRPTYGLKTNEKTSDMSLFKTLISNINIKSISGEEYFDNISQYIDVDNFLKYSALCYIFGLPDDLRNNSNNYYLYFNKENKALFLPYDNYRCLGIRYGWDIDLKDVSWDDPYMKGSNNDFNSCPLILRLISGGSNNSHPVHQTSKENYHNYVISFANKYLNKDKFNDFTSAFEGIAPSIDINEAGDYNDTFEEYINHKNSVIN